MSRDITALDPLAAEQRLRYGNEPSQFFDLWNASGSSLGSAVFIHGGFWRARYDLCHASHLCAALAAAGISTANLEYRRVGEPGGGWPGSFEDVLAGVKAAADFFGGQPAVVGHSAGGHLALRLAGEIAMIKGAVALAPVADLRLAHELDLSNGAVSEFLGKNPDEAPERLRAADPRHHPPKVRTVLVHGDRDDVVPVRMSREFVRSTKSSPRPELIELPGADHFDLIDPESMAWPKVRDCVLELLRQG